MKIRIKGNSVRFRLSRTDVRNLAETGMVAERTAFGAGEAFSYALKTDEYATEIGAGFQNGGITITLPAEKANIITQTEQMGIEAYVPNGEEGGLFVLIEKDLQCSDSTLEDQSDMYENPNKNC